MDDQKADHEAAQAEQEQEGVQRDAAGDEQPVAAGQQEHDARHRAEAQRGPAPRSPTKPT